MVRLSRVVCGGVCCACRRITSALGQQIAALEADRRALLRHSHEAAIERVRQRMQLQGLGINGAWVFVMELFGWRALKTRRAVGG